LKPSSEWLAVKEVKGVLKKKRRRDDAPKRTCPEKRKLGLARRFSGKKK